jgi:hypothetical protein
VSANDYDNFYSPRLAGCIEEFLPSEDAALQTTDVYKNLPLLRDLAVALSEKLEETKPVTERISHQSKIAPLVCGDRCSKGAPDSIPF